MRKATTILCAAIALVALPGQAADDLGTFTAALEKVFLKHYPGAQVATTKEGAMTVEFQTRVFQIHEPLKTGAWQEASAQRGPQPGGVYCEIVAEAGPYQGAAEVPQTLDKHYFRVLLLAPYSKALDRHLHVQLAYPADASPDFLREITVAINRFGGD